MLSRRDFLALAAAHAGLALTGCRRTDAALPRVVVNDVHSRLNPTTVFGPVRPVSRDALVEALARATRQGLPISLCGSRHAMGGQQFAGDSLLIDTTGLDRVLAFDRERGLIEVEAGIQWPALIEYLLRVQAADPRPWAIAQKQTGADLLTIGGAVAANIHGRGLTMQPFAGDVESLVVIDAAGQARRCSRLENAELFALVLGGYGLFGVVASVQLRLARRTKLERVVIETRVDDLLPLFDQRIAEGFIYGDFQYAIDETSPDFLRQGILSCYRPVAPETPIPERQERMSAQAWRHLARLAHEDRARAYRVYADYYLSTSGQIYWSDLHQLSTYVADYHTDAGPAASEMISELYVPRDRLAAFLADARTCLRATRVPVVYGTVRLIAPDDTSFLAWARQPWACTIFNLHVEHTPAGLQQAADAFRGLIAAAMAQGGSYYLTYHRWATRAQVEASHPRMVEFLKLKRQYDPQDRFTSEWYRHYRAMFADQG